MHFIIRSVNLGRLPPEHVSFKRRIMALKQSCVFKSQIHSFAKIIVANVSIALTHRTPKFPLSHTLCFVTLIVMLCQIRVMRMLNTYQFKLVKFDRSSTRKQTPLMTFVYCPSSPLADSLLSASKPSSTANIFFKLSILMFFPKT